MFGAIIFLPLFLQVVTGASATNSGLLLPLLSGVIVSSITSGRLITRTARYKVFPIVGMALTSVGLILFSRMDAHTTRAAASAFMVATGLGMELLMQVMVLAVQNAVSHRDLGTATAAVSFFRSIGAVFGTAIFGAVLSNRLTYYLPRLVPAGAGRLGGNLRALQGSPQHRRAPSPGARRRR